MKEAAALDAPAHDIQVGADCSRAAAIGTAYLEVSALAVMPRDRLRRSSHEVRRSDNVAIGSDGCGGTGLIAIATFHARDLAIMPDRGALQRRIEARVARRRHRDLTRVTEYLMRAEVRRDVAQSVDPCRHGRRILYDYVDALR